MSRKKGSQASLLLKRLQLLERRLQTSETSLQEERSRRQQVETHLRQLERFQEHQEHQEERPDADWPTQANLSHQLKEYEAGGADATVFLADLGQRLQLRAQRDMALDALHFLAGAYDKLQGQLAEVRRATSAPEEIELTPWLHALLVEAEQMEQLQEELQRLGMEESRPVHQVRLLKQQGELGQLLEDIPVGWSLTRSGVYWIVESEEAGLLEFAPTPKEALRAALENWRDLD